MTLLMMMSKAEGIYMSVDYQLTLNKQVVDDAATKHLTVHYSIHDRGTRALFGFTGAAEYRDGTPTVEWLRQTMRGVTDVAPDPSMTHLRQRLDRDFGPMRVPLIVNFLTVHPEGRFVGGLSNLKKSKDKPQTKFEYICHPVTQSLVMANGSAGTTLFASGQIARLKSQLSTTPRRALDHMKLMASVNRRIAALDSTASPQCQVAFVPGYDFLGNPKFAASSQIFREPGESAPFTMPLLVSGVDATDIIQFAHEQSQLLRRGIMPDDPIDATQFDLTRRP